MSLRVSETSNRITKHETEANLEPETWNLKLPKEPRLTLSLPLPIFKFPRTRSSVG